MANIKAFFYTIGILSLIVGIGFLVVVSAVIVVPILAFVLLFLIIRGVTIMEDMEDEDIPPRPHKRN